VDNLLRGMIILETEEQWKEIKKRWEFEQPRRPFKDIGIIGETKPNERGKTKLVEFGIVRSLKDWDALDGRWSWPKS